MYQSIAEIYANNDRVRENFRSTIDALTDDQLSILPDGEKWTVTQIVEHMSLVDEGMVRICAKLLGKAEAAGKMADGIVTISDNFAEKGAEIAKIKVQAPDFVQPVSGASIGESLTRMEGNQKALDDLREKFEHFDGTEFKFPHPFFGDISAHEWLALRGGHEARHLKQIKSLAEKIG